MVDRPLNPVILFCNLELVQEGQAKQAGGRESNDVPRPGDWLVPPRSNNEVGPNIMG